MTKSILLLLLGVFLVSALETVVSEPKPAEESVDKFSLPLTSSVRSLSLQSMVGKWYEVGSSQQVRKIFQKNCQCLSSTIKMAHNNILHILNECLNKTTNKIVAVNGTLTQVMAKSFPGAFHMEFKAENKSGSSVVETQNKDKIEEEVKVESKDKLQDKETDVKKDVKKEGEELKKGNVGENEEKEKINKEELAKMIKDKDINFLLLKNVDNNTLLIGGPTSELIWIWSRKPVLDESIFRSCKNQAKRLGFQRLIKADSCPHSDLTI